MESGSANGVAVEGAGRSIRLGAEVEQRELRQSSRKADREGAEATALFWRGGLLLQIYTHMCELFGRTIGHMWITVILEKHTTAALHLKCLFYFSC